MNRTLKATLAAALLISSVGTASAADRRVEIVNRTGMAMTNFYASNTGTNSWEEDILGRDVVANGASVVVDIDDGTGACRFDFKAVFQGGASSVKQGINVCEITTFTYTP